MVGFPIWLRWSGEIETLAVPSDDWRRGWGGDVIARYADRSELELCNLVMLALLPLRDAKTLAMVQVGLRLRLSQVEVERVPPEVL